MQSHQKTRQSHGDLREPKTQAKTRIILEQWPEYQE